MVTVEVSYTVTREKCHGATIVNQLSIQVYIDLAVSVRAALSLTI